MCMVLFSILGWLNPANLITLSVCIRTCLEWGSGNLVLLFPEFVTWCWSSSTSTRVHMAKQQRWNAPHFLLDSTECILIADFSRNRLFLHENSWDGELRGRRMSVTLHAAHHITFSWASRTFYSNPEQESHRADGIPSQKENRFTWL